MKKDYQEPKAEVFSMQTGTIVCESGKGHTNDYDKEDW